MTKGLTKSYSQCNIKPDTVKGDQGNELSQYFETGCCELECLKPSKDPGPVV